MTISKPVLTFMLIALVVAILIGAWLIFQKQSSPGETSILKNDPNSIRYLPLGDSYTIGEGVPENERWPNQLADRYMPRGKRLQIIDNPSITGYTTQNLIDKELPLVKKLKPDFVTLLIGVNDYVQGVDAKNFETNYRYIVSQLKQEMSNPDNILLVTIPDFAKTPGGATFNNPTAVTSAVQAFNKIIISIAKDENLPVADIFIVSQKVADDTTLAADDGLHPSGEQYSLWTDVAEQALKSSKILE